MRRSKLLGADVLMILATVLVGSAIAFATSAGASKSGPIHTIHINEDSFKAYDFTKQVNLNNEAESRTHADWGIDLIFWGKANVDLIKSRLAFAYPYSGIEMVDSNMWAAVNNNGKGWTWDSDEGIKTTACPLKGETAYHMRIYAPSSTDYFQSQNWGKYVIASTHKDHSECLGGAGKWHGASEAVERSIANLWAATYGGNVQHNRYDMKNRMETAKGGPIIQGNHHWQQSGKATLVLVQ